jgi:hypothetical protein
MHLLFIGNSFTARNDLPGRLAKLAAERGHRVTHDLISAGGASLRAHWNKGSALEAIGKGRYDHVVLQEQSTLPIRNARRFHENVRLFIEPIRASGATPVLYLTWARKNAPATQRALAQPGGTPRQQSRQDHEPDRNEGPGVVTVAATESIDH